MEMKYFSMWWEEQSDHIKAEVKSLVKSGRLELLNAGWSMHDEACPTYDDMMNNMMQGHEFVLREFGVTPRVGWQIDPFGHSSANARLFAEMGFDAFFFARTDYRDKQQRKQDKSLEFLWQPMHDTLGKDAEILAHVLNDHYSAPPGFDFDFLGPAEDNFTLDGNDTAKFIKADELYNYIIDMKGHYRSQKNLFLTMGDDFRFQNASMYFSQSDELIKYFNTHFKDKHVQLVYSTPSMYVDALSREKIEFPHQFGDLMPYADNAESYWTGFFSSRPNDKLMIRDASHLLHSSNDLFALEHLKRASKVAETMRENVARDLLMDALGVT